MTKLKNSNCDKTQKLKVWQKTQNVKKKKFKNLNCDKTEKNQIVTKFKIQIVTKVKKQKPQIGIFFRKGPGGCDSWDGWDQEINKQLEAQCGQISFLCYESI